MPWFFPFSDAIKKRACRYLLQRYLGQFLEQKLSLDQLEIKVYEGTGSISDILLDVDVRIVTFFMSNPPDSVLPHF
jgi:autophagy-related protein 2